MKVLLIDPPSAFGDVGTDRVLGSWGSYKADLAWAPADLIIVGGLFEKYGIEFEVFDANNQKLGFDDVKKKIAEYKPDLVAFLATPPTVGHDILTAKVAKEVSQKIKTALFGLSMLPIKENPMEEYSFLDFFVFSEPELPLLELVQANLDAKSVLGIIHRKKGKIIKNNPHPKETNLDNFGIPTHEKLPLQIYRDPLTVKRPMAVVSASRGCVNACSHCMALFHKPMRYRSVENVIEELRRIKKLGVKEIKFYDCGLTNDLEFSRKLFRRMIGENFGFSWYCSARADCLPTDLVQLMKKSGCHTVCIGTESANAAVLKKMGKNETVQDFENAIKNIKKAGMKVLIFCCFGFEGETKQTIRETIDFAKRVNPDYVTFGVVMPVMGTRFYDFLLKNNYFNPQDIAMADTCKPPIYNYPELSSEEIYEAMMKAYREFYLRPSFIIKRFFRSPRTLLQDAANFFSFAKLYVLKKN